MNKMDEMIECVPASIVNELAPDAIGKTPAKNVATILAQKVTKRRGDVENDPSWKQIIPYGVLVQEGMWFRELTVLSYRRATTSGEKRLHSLRSIGFGGHMKAGETLVECIKRELNEELRYVNIGWDAVLKNYIYDSQETFWTLNDVSTPVNAVHFGVVGFVYADLPHVKANEDTIEDVTPSTWSELFQSIDQYEPWSRMLIRAWEYPKEKVDENIGCLIDNKENE